MLIEILGSFAAGILTGLLLYHARERRVAVEKIRGCVSVVWCSHCGMTQSALCQKHKLPAEYLPT